MELDLAMTSPPRRGRPATGRKVVLQAAFEPEDVEAITEIAEAEGDAISAVLRDLVLEALAGRKRKRK
jgi:hypothetical protein